jgi:hypothetical protein
LSGYPPGRCFDRRAAETSRRGRGCVADAVKDYSERYRTEISGLATPSQAARAAARTSLPTASLAPAIAHANLEPVVTIAGAIRLGRRGQQSYGSEHYRDHLKPQTASVKDLLRGQGRRPTQPPSEQGVPSITRRQKKGALLTKGAFRGGYSLLTGALVIGAICLASPSHSQLRP